MWVAIVEQRLRAARCARRGFLLAAIVALPAFAGTASAATVSKSAPTLTYQAVAGETNFTVVTKSGDDIMRGSLTPIATDGVDRVTYTANTAAQPTTISLDGVANDSDGQGGTDNVSTDIEYLYGGPEVDSFDALSALQGVSFWTGAGDDTLNGSNFDDYFDGQAGSDTQNCRGGTDTYKIDGADPAPVNCEIGQ